MIKVRSRPEKNYKDIKAVYFKWDKLVERAFKRDYENYCPLFYFSKDGKEFMYIDSMMGFFLPNEYNLNILEILEDDITFSNWELKYVNRESGYLKNQLKRGFGLYEERILDIIPKEEISDAPGSWNLLDTDTGTKIEFAISLSTSYWGSNILELGFPEKTLVPFNRNLIIRKELFILNIIKEVWKNRS